jgi:LysM repeat protein
MSQVQTHTTESQTKTGLACQSEQESAHPSEQGLVQPVAPQAAYRRAQVNPNGLTSADLLALQRTVGNRQVQHILIHGLSHVLAQGGGQRHVQRYEAGEHAELGATERPFKDLATPAAITYKVKKGELPEKIAKDFAVSMEELKELNKDKLHKWTTKSGRTIEGFNQGETIVIPPQLNPAVKDTLKTTGQMIVNVNGAKLEYGEIIAMGGDMFEDVNDLLTMNQTQLEEIAKLIKEEKTTGKPLDAARWDKATGGRFVKLAEKNEKHFAPSNAGLVPVSTSPHGGDHKSEWEKYHQNALELSQKGKKDEALLNNAFGDHFLTDAFSAGHLFNKRDVMMLFQSKLPMTPDKKFTKDSVAFFDAIAKASFVGPVKTAFSPFEPVKPYALGWRPNIDSVRAFSALLQEIQKARPDLLSSVIAKAVHDKLNKLPGRLAVSNNKGDRWPLSGDTTLNDQTKGIARKAVAQSQLNVLTVFNQPGALDLPVLFKKVWDYTPVPTAAGVTEIQNQSNMGTDLKNSDLVAAVVALITTNYQLILDGLVKEGYLRKA